MRRNLIVNRTKDVHYRLMIILHSVRDGVTNIGIDGTEVQVVKLK